MDPTISVLTTTFNREDYLEDCMLSILDSSFKNLDQQKQFENRNHIRADNPQLSHAI